MWDVENSLRRGKWKLRTKSDAYFVSYNQWVPGALYLGVKRPGREADNSPLFSAEVKEWVELYLHSPNTPPWRGAQLKHRDNFTFTLFYVFFVP
jgi:hypothetical protein